MNTDEREVISLDVAKRELEKMCKDLLHTANVFLFVGLLMGGMMQFFISAIGDKSFWQILIWIVTMLPCVALYCDYFRFRYIVKHEYFGIVTDTLEKIERDQINWLSRRDSLKDVFHFKRCGKFVPHALNTMPYASEGDTYYILIIQTSKIKIVKPYSDKIYRLEQNN